MRNNSDSFSLFLNFVRVKYDRGVVLKYIGVDDYKKSFFLDFDVVYAVRVKFKNKLDLTRNLNNFDLFCKKDRLLFLLFFDQQQKVIENAGDFAIDCIGKKKCFFTGKDKYNLRAFTRYVQAFANRQFISVYKSNQFDFYVAVFCVFEIQNAYSDVRSNNFFRWFSYLKSKYSDCKINYLLAKCISFFICGFGFELICGLDMQFCMCNHIFI